jgi:hypothetical protein
MYNGGSRTSGSDVHHPSEYLCPDSFDVFWVFSNQPFSDLVIERRYGSIGYRARVCIDFTPDVIPSSVST